MRDALQRIATSYPKARQQKFADHPLAAFIRNEATVALKDALGSEARHLLIRGSAGVGRWAEVPWLAIMDPQITDTPQQGYLVAYLFPPPGRRVVLSLLVGFGYLRKTLGTKEARAEIAKRVARLRRRVGKELERFQETTLHVGDCPPSSRAAFYEAAHVMGKTYQVPLPGEQRMLNDLREMVKLYR